MKLRIFNAVCCLTLLSAVVPGKALAQDTKPTTCPDQNISLRFNMDGLASLSELSSLADLADLSSLADLAELEDIPELMKLSDIAQELEGLHNDLILDQTGESTIIINQDADAAYDTEKRKTFDKTYNVSNSDALSIENKFGSVQVNTWAKNEIRVKVDIIARASNENKAQEILNNINVVDGRSDNTISVVTKMEPMRISGNTSKSFEINYTIYMPESNALAVKNSFGDVTLAALKGKTDISVKYGSLKSARLSNADNKVKLAYSSGTCAFINGGNVDVAYSSMDIGNTNGLWGSSKFSDFKINSLRDELGLEVKFGTFKVDNVEKNVRKIALDSSYTPISLKFEDNSAFNFDVNVSFADFKVDKSLVNITSLEKGHTSAEYKGRYGGSAGKGSVSISSKYGEVKFTK
ncbi:hypothetical protein [uncultured Pontibacter sp.]|uniref:hypothetical protein n=1 Tax=uncultured Pontibacter sp. TaxID=453356 RepID=UPI00262F3BD1|nr:hypothetical protein [uncultured Pontibacter sp.]